MVGQNYSRVNATGRSSSRIRRQRSRNDNYVTHYRALLESSAFRALSFAARRVLDRLEVEHLRHGGRENGQLICTYTDFEQWGVRRGSIPGAIRELVALGFLEVVSQGRRSSAQFRAPHVYRLTHVHGNLKPTDEWEKIGSDEEAREVIRAANPRRKFRKPAA